MKNKYGVLVFLILIICFQLACKNRISPEPPLSLTNTPLPEVLSPMIAPTPKVTEAILLTPTVITEYTPELLTTLEVLQTPQTATHTNGESEPHLTAREPTSAQLRAYLLPFIEGSEHFLDHVGRAFELYYEDVNGDGETDLVVSDYLLVAVFLWIGDGYSEPFLIQEALWKVAPGSHVYLEDWTNDNVPEVIFDYHGDTGGTGLLIDFWDRYIIHCGMTTCQTAWYGRLQAMTNNYNYGGVALQSLNVELKDQDNVWTLQSTSEAFSIYTYGLNPPLFDGYQVDSLNILTSTWTIYQWTGLRFELADEQIISLPQVIPSQAVLSSRNAFGEEAIITITKFNVGTNQNDLCEISVSGKTIGEPFGCKENFTTLEWRDITNDGIDELTSVALSGTTDAQGILLTDKDCVHQRFLAYQWIGSNLVEVANVAGCVFQSDLFGVRVEDIDMDGQFEILAANIVQKPTCPVDVEEQFHVFACWRELIFMTEVYGWDGSQFVWEDNVPVE